MNYICMQKTHEAKYQFLINKRESTGLRHFNVLKAFIEYSNNKMFTKLLKNTTEVRDE